MKLEAPRGVPDYVPPESAEFLTVRNTLAKSPQLAGYGYVEIPVFESEELFTRGMGRSTDVVRKEMYTFTDRGGRDLALRPEGTAGVTRALIQRGLVQGALPVKVWYAGPFFRAERPQHGRYRQLQQVGIEAVGSDDPALDAEVIALADAGFRDLGLTQFRLLLTSLGCRNCRPAYRELLSEFLAKLDLDEPTRERAELNPLRVLDDKREAVQSQLVDAPLIVDHLCAECAEHFAETKSFLDTLGVPWEAAPRLVRGLDYYTRTTFEFDHPLLGAQSGIGGGGRYDGLVAELGGPDISGIGWGIGTDRTLLACGAEGIDLPVPRLDVFLLPLAPPARPTVVELGQTLRSQGIRTDQSYGQRGLKGAMKAANRSGARFVGIVGDDEMARGTIQLKHLADGVQQEVALAEAVNVLKENHVTNS